MKYFLFMIFLFGCYEKKYLEINEDLLFLIKNSKKTACIKLKEEPFLNDRFCIFYKEGK